MFRMIHILLLSLPNVGIADRKLNPSNDHIYKTQKKLALQLSYKILYPDKVEASTILRLCKRSFLSVESHKAAML